MKTMTVVPERCVGCRLCELVCSLKHVGEFNPTRARIQVMGFEDVFSLPVMCFQCETPHCAAVCPTGSIIRDGTTGIVEIVKEKCVGCKTCTLACPFGGIVFSSDERVAVKCNTCKGEPECVAICPTHALEFKEADTAMLHKKKTLSEKLKKVYEGMKQLG